MRVVLNQFSCCGQLQSLSNVVAWFADTLPAAKATIPGLKSYSLSALYTEVFAGSFKAHDAECDVAALKQLTDTRFKMCLLLRHSTTFQSAYEHNLISLRQKSVADELKQNIPRAHLSKSMASKIAQAGLQYAHLQLAFSRKGADGLRLLL